MPKEFLLTLYRSSAVAYRYGVSGPFWYASGATVQVLLFATLAIELKRKSPNAHTFLEVIKARYGVATHAVYITFGLVTNILVTAMLLTGGSAVVSDLTGVPTAAACFLLPIGVVLYTMFGGIKATFLTDYVHTVMIFSEPLHISIFVSGLTRLQSSFLFSHLLLTPPTRSLDRLRGSTNFYSKQPKLTLLRATLVGVI